MRRPTRHAWPCWRSKDEVISDVLLWTPAYGQAKAGRQLEHTYSSYVRIRDVALIPARGEERLGWVARESQGYPCPRHDMMMMMIYWWFSKRYKYRIQNIMLRRLLKFCIHLISKCSPMALENGRVIPNTQKMVLDPTLLNNQHYKVRIKCKVEQFRNGVTPS